MKLLTETSTILNRRSLKQQRKRNLKKRVVINEGDQENNEVSPFEATKTPAKRKEEEYHKVITRSQKKRLSKVTALKRKRME
jgi:hypothetical protein